MRRCNLLLVGALMLGGCGREAPPRIGVIVSHMPGTAAALAAAEQAPGEPGFFEAVMPESGSPLSDARQAIEQATGFVRDARVVAVVGHANSPASLAASQIYNSAGLLQIAPTTTAPIYSEAGPFSFRLVPGDTLQAEYLYDSARRMWPDADRIAVVHVNDDYGRGLSRSLRPRLDSVVFEGIYADDADSADVAMLAEGIAEEQPDLLIWLGRPRVLGEVLHHVRTALPGLHALCGDACDVAAVYANEDGRFTRLVFVRFTNPSAPDSSIMAFQARYRERTGERASSEALLTYDAVALVRAALRDGARSREQVRRYLVSLGTERPAFEGLTGGIAFDRQGDVTRSYLLAEVVGPDSVVAAD